MEYRLEIKSDAKDDIKSITKYVFDRNPIAADKIYNRIMQVIDSVAGHPNIGGDANLRFGVKSGYRYFPVYKYAYIIFYKIDKDLVSINRVLDGRRDCLAVLGAE